MLTRRAAWARVKLQLLDQGGAPIRKAGISVADTIQVGSPNDLGFVSGVSLTGSFNTDTLGHWPDTYLVCSSACPWAESSMPVNKNHGKRIGYFFSPPLSAPSLGACQRPMLFTPAGFGARCSAIFRPRLMNFFLFSFSP